MLARELGLILSIGGLALAQVTLLSTPLGFSVPLLLVLAICRTLIGVGSAFPDIGVIRGLRWSLYSGISFDILAATPLGSHALAMLLATFAVAAAARHLHIEGPMLPLIAVFIGSLIYESVLALLLQPGMVNWASTARIALIPGVLAAVLLALPAFFGLRWMLRV
ncbi:MAG: rod shape-determining protein MreD [Chloroflexales bacterium]